MMWRPSVLACGSPTTGVRVRRSVLAIRLSNRHAFAPGGSCSLSTKSKFEPCSASTRSCRPSRAVLTAVTCNLGPLSNHAAKGLGLSGNSI